MSKRVTEKELKKALAASEAALRQSLVRLSGVGPAGDDLGRKAASVARSHPVVTTIAGAGLAGLALWLARRPSPEPSAEALTRWEDEGGLPVDAGEIDAAAEAWLEKARAARDAAGRRLLALYEQGRVTADEKANVLQDMAEDLSAAFRDNLSDLTDDAAERVVAARESAWDAITRGKDMASAGAKTVRRHPMASTALGLAAGTLVALLFPRTRPVLGKAVPIAASVALAQAVAAFARERGAADKVAAGARRTTNAAKTDTEEPVRDMARTTTTAAGAEKKTARKSTPKSREVTAAKPEATTKTTRRTKPAKKAATTGASVASAANGATAH